MSAVAEHLVCFDLDDGLEEWEQRVQRSTCFGGAEARRGREVRVGDRNGFTNAMDSNQD